MKINLNKNFKKRLENFLNSDDFKLKEDYHKSEYWKHHSLQVKYKFTDTGINIIGESGFYIPPKKKFLKNNLKKILKFFKLKSNKFEDAFNFIFNNNTSNYNLNFKKEDLIAKNINQIENSYPFNYSINDQIIERIYIGRVFKNDTERMEKLFDGFSWCVKGRFSVGSGTCMYPLEKKKTRRARVVD